VDCGGTCSRCPTCADGLRNGNEQGVDCGGDCDVCPTCYDEILNGYEEGVDCGGSCDACPTCYDNIRNGEEQGVDCGGDCPAVCIPLFAPLTTGWRIFLLLLILVVVLIVIYLLLRKKIDSFYTKTKEKIMLFLEKFKKEEEVEYKSILEKVVEKLIDLENSIGKEKTKELFDDLLYILKGFFTDLLDIDYEFTYEELKKELKKQKINKKLIKGAVECYKEIENSRYTEEEQNEQKLRELINKAKVVVRNLVLLKTLIEEEENISTLIKRGEEFVRKKDKLNSKIFYMKTLQVYKSLDETEKSKHYNKIKNLHTLISDMKEGDDTGKKMLSIILVFASVFFLSFFIGPQKTGFVVFENQPLQMENISTQYAVVGERYYSELNIYGGMGKITFFDDTELFEVSNEGVIDFIPKEEQRGLHKIVVIVEDEGMSRDHKLIKFRIE
ncbi:hypothetical protein HQ529_01590, partial [Candidatus Woesearchaeota archaeon]|nr:hypothetical protein [Candidatus Woesearchaeota archaeon]